MATKLDPRGLSTYDDSGLKARIAKITDGASDRFFDAAEKGLKPVKADAEAVWPRGIKPGPRSADSFEMERRYPEGKLQSALVNRARQDGRYYVNFIKFSVRTRRSLEREASQFAMRATTPQAADSLRTAKLKSLERNHGRGAPNERLAGKRAWTTLIRTPGKRAARKAIPELEKDLVKLAEG